MADARAAGSGSGVPMFYRRPEALNPERHADKRLAPVTSHAFAATAHAIPLMAGEMPSAMRSYPIVFVGDQYTPVAIAGLRRDQNLFVDESGHWIRPHYVPAYVRRYPYVLAGNEAAGQLTLCIEMESGLVFDEKSAPADAAPFFENGQPSEAVRNALAFCEQYQKMLNVTRSIVARIAAHELFVTREGKVKLESGETTNLTDFKVVDEQALNRLGDEAFLDLRRSGALPMIYCHLASMNSWGELMHLAGQKPAR